MYFFRIKISSFDDEEKTLFVIPEQNADEKGVPFDEKLLTQTAEYKQFVKDTATNMVDGEYTQYQTETVFDTIDEQQFAQLEAEGKLTTVDSNAFSISTGIKPAKKGGGTLDFKTIAIIAAIAVAGLALLIFSFARGGASGETSTDLSESSETVESTTSETSTTEPETSETSSTDGSSVTESSTESSGFVDEPPESTVSEPSDNSTTDDNGYTDVGYRPTTNSSSGGQGGVYQISFNANGGEGAINGISAEAGQYVTLPSAAEASKYISKKGYKLIGFSDNTEISYPLYHYKMPYENVTMFAVWEPDTFTVTYNSNGGTGKVSRAEVKYGDSVPLPTDIPVYKD